MTPEQQHIAIAEAFGLIITDHSSLSPEQWHDWYANVASIIPDYLNSLDAMHEAEKVLTRNAKTRFDNHIYQLCGSWSLAIHATAAQRAEAFLRTFNLWTP